jgi:hypothetical protein
MADAFVWGLIAVTAIWGSAGAAGRKWLNETIGKWLGVGLWWVLKGAGTGLWWLVCLPFRGRRTRGLRPTREERRLMARLAPAHWRSHAPQRGLDGTITGRAKLTPSGITVSVRLDEKWTWRKFRDSEAHIRALLGARTGLRIEIAAGPKGTHASLVLRTRSAADGDDMLWSPHRTSFGVDTVTGEEFNIPLGHRMLIAGMSGSGKSTAARPLMFFASEGETNRLLIIDLKRIEGRLWDHRARVALTAEQVLALVKEVCAELEYRTEMLVKGQSKWTPTAEHPRLTILVDEGSEVMSKVKKALDDLESIARMGRAVAIDIWWATQKPTLDSGVPKQIAPQLHVAVGLHVRTPTEARVIFGENATDEGWHADKLPLPGYAMVYLDPQSKPHPIRVREMKDPQVIALPPRPVWEAGDGAPKGPQDGEEKTLDIPPVDHAEAVVMALSATAEPLDSKTLIRCCGLSRSQGYALLKRLAAEGRITKQRHGYYALGEGAS